MSKLIDWVLHDDYFGVHWVKEIFGFMFSVPELHEIIKFGGKMGVGHKDCSLLYVNLCQISNTRSNELRSGRGELKNLFNLKLYFKLFWTDVSKHYFQQMWVKIRKNTRKTLTANLFGKTCANWKLQERGSNCMRKWRFWWF